MKGINIYYKKKTICSTIFIELYVESGGKKMELLPLGTIVVLRDEYKKLIIIGRKIYSGNGEKLNDYLGCLYPEGYLGEE